MRDMPIAITGIGVFSPLGGTPQAMWDGLAGQAELRGPWAKRALSAYPVDNVVSIPEDLWASLPGAQARGDNRSRRIAAYAVDAALADAQADPLSQRAGCVLGTTTAGVEIAENQLRLPSAHCEALSDADMDGSSIVPDHARGAPWRGPTLVLSMACSSGLAAPAQAIDMLRAGEADLMVAGGVDVLLEYTVCGFNGLRLASGGPCRPFDAGRRGVVLSEGAACFCLEPLDAALQRGARVRAVIAGYGISCDAEHVTAPDLDGVRRAVCQALAAAGVKPEQLGAVFTHGTGTLANDATEVAALRAAFGTQALPPLTSVKSILGHSQAAAGAFSLLAATLSLAQGGVPPTAGLQQIDPALDVDVVHGGVRALSARHVLVDAFGFGGNNCVMVLAHPAAYAADIGRLAA